jgi:transcription antitermination protein NusB
MRHRGRETAFHLLFEASYRPSEFPLDIEGEMDRYAAMRGNVPDSARAFALHLVRGALREESHLDEKIEKAGSHWRIERIGLTEKVILRIAIFELGHPDPQGEVLPAEIVIDEAIELAKIYGGDDAPAFVNGVLDAVAGRRG